MALYKYFKRVYDENLPDPLDSLSAKGPSEIIVETNKQVKKVLSRKRGEYNKISSKDKAIVGKYARGHGVTKTVRQFKNKNLSMRDRKKMYEKELMEMSRNFVVVGEEVRVKSLPGKTCGQPPLLSKKWDKYPQETIMKICCREH